MDMFYQEEVLYEDPTNTQGTSSTTTGTVGGGLRSRPAQTYDEVVKDLIMCEKSYLRDLYMITKVGKKKI